MKQVGGKRWSKKKKKKKGNQRNDEKKKRLGGHDTSIQKKIEKWERKKKRNHKIRQEI